MTSAEVTQAAARVARAVKAGNAVAEQDARAALATARLRAELQALRARGVTLTPEQVAELRERLDRLSAVGHLTT